MSNTGTRVLFAIIAIPGVVLLAWLGGYFWFAFVAAVLLASAREFAAMARQKGADPQLWALGVGGVLLALAFLNERLASDLASVTEGGFASPFLWQSILWVALLFALIVPIVELFRNRGSALLNLSTTFFGMFYIALFLSCAVGMREIFSVLEFPVGRVFGTAALSAAQLSTLDAWGGYTVVSVLASIWLCDTAAYFGGRSMGRHKLFPRVSPNKTWEGAVWGLLAAVGSMIAARALVLDYLTVEDAVVIGLCVGVLGQLGDLVESLLKRDSGVKDSSSLLPGHGGVFDRFDSFIFVSPAVFLYLDFVVFA